MVVAAVKLGAIVPLVLGVVVRLVKLALVELVTVILTVAGWTQNRVKCLP